MQKYRKLKYYLTLFFLYFLLAPIAWYVCISYGHEYSKFLHHADSSLILNYLYYGITGFCFILFGSASIIAFPLISVLSSYLQVDQTHFIVRMFHWLALAINPVIFVLIASFIIKTGKKLNTFHSSLKL